MRVTRRARHNQTFVVDGVSPFTILLRKLRGEVLRKLKNLTKYPGLPAFAALRRVRPAFANQPSHEATAVKRLRRGRRGFLG